MNLLNFARNKKAKWIMKNSYDELLSIKQICDTLHTGYPDRVDLDKKLPMICCFEGVFVKDCLFVHYERDKDTVAHNAMKNGARALLCSHQIADYPCIIVDDVLTALKHILLPMYDQIRIPTTAITGSCGKTTTKNFINCVYSSQYNTFCNVTNGNTFEYIGFEIQRFDKKAQLFVQEVNESDPFNAKNASEVLKPQIVCITNMDKSHIGELGSEENIMRAICDITAGMDENGIVVVNGDDPNSSKAIFNQKVIRVSIKNKTADCFADNIKSTADSVSFDLHYLDECANIVLPIGGVHNIYNAQMAYVCGRLQGISSEKIVRGDCILFKGSRSMHLNVAIKKAFPYAFIKGMVPVLWAYFMWTVRTL